MASHRQVSTLILFLVFTLRPGIVLSQTGRSPGQTANAADFDNSLMESTLRQRQGDVQQTSGKHVATAELDGEEEGELVGEEEQDVHQKRMHFTASLLSRQASARDRTRNSGDCQSVLNFDTVTDNMQHHYNPLTSSFTAPVAGIYTFSLRLHRQLRHHKKWAGVDVHLVKTLHHHNSWKTLCSIVSDRGAESAHNPAMQDSPGQSRDHNDNAKSLLFHCSEDDVSDHGVSTDVAKWDFESQLRWTGAWAEDWDKAPESFWDQNHHVGTADGYCEGMTHLRPGDRVFVRRHHCRNDNTDIDVTWTDDVTWGDFSGYLLTEDL